MKFTAEEVEIIEKFLIETGMNKNQLVTNAVRDFIRNNSTINPYDSRDE